ncbi:unnamed protein product [Clonostachys chloroleuca]|uniref:Uncharacterized protein n=1 Tax=Clonostachys chloroleuca TaxID=1926264 RepID=A0AA35M7I8_9HYPO|nr:unnamed protein product [Clonostachys chloroleuca]
MRYHKHYKDVSSSSTSQQLLSKVQMSRQLDAIDEQLAILHAERETLITMIQGLETRKEVLETEMVNCQVESAQLDKIDNDLENIIHKVHSFSAVGDRLISGNRNPHEAIRRSLQAIYETCIPQMQEEIISDFRALEMELDDILVHISEANETLRKVNELYGALD